MREWFAKNFPTLDGPKLMMIPVLVILIAGIAEGIMQPINEPGTALSDYLWAE